MRQLVRKPMREGLAAVPGLARQRPVSVRARQREVRASAREHRQRVAVAPSFLALPVWARPAHRDAPGS